MPYPIEPDPDQTLQAAESAWPDPVFFGDEIRRWLPLATGRPRALTALSLLVRSGNPVWQRGQGLEWMEHAIAGDFEAAASAAPLITWAADQYPDVLHDPTALGRWRRLMDGLAAAGSSAAARLQRAEEARR